MQYIKSILNLFFEAGAQTITETVTVNRYYPIGICNSNRY